ncbi:anti-anti-sigma regulatory factor [Streptomyces sp. V1I1]|nr:anti-anti-sigma regulatory factor [Streptomyces sp. V1I1]
MNLVTFCDCSGLNVLLRTRARAREAEMSFTVVGAQAPVVARLFYLTENWPLLGPGWLPPDPHH